MTSEVTRKSQTRWKSTAVARGKAKAKALAMARKHRQTNKTKGATCAARNVTSHETAGDESTKAQQLTKWKVQEKDADEAQ